MSDAVKQELIACTQRLLESIVSSNWKAYEELCDPTLTCFEPEAQGQLVEGMPFHKFFFDLPNAGGPVTTTMASPHVRMLGKDAAVVSYVRLTEKLDGSGGPVIRGVEETRVWERQNGKWRHVHFHRSPLKA